MEIKLGNICPNYNLWNRRYLEISVLEIWVHCTAINQFMTSGFFHLVISQKWFPAKTVYKSVLPLESLGRMNNHAGWLRRKPLIMRSSLVRKKEIADNLGRSQIWTVTAGSDTLCVYTLCNWTVQFAVYTLDTMKNFQLTVRPNFTSQL